MSSQMTLPGIPAPISSPASAAGNTPSNSPDGPLTARSGPVAALVSLSARPDVEVAPLTSVTFGRSFIGSSQSAALQSSLENRLRAELAGTGSPLYALTWRRWDMPSGPPICALRASAPRTSASGCSGEPSGWGTPTAQDAKHGSLSPAQEARDPNVLHNQAHLASGWPTPQARDHKGAPNPGNELTHNARPLNEVARLTSGWPTPCTPSGGRSTSTDKMDATGRTTDGRKHTASLEHAAKFAPTPGPTSNGSPAPTASGGQLAPDFVCWMMGYPPEHLSSAPTATRSSRK